MADSVHVSHRSRKILQANLDVEVSDLTTDVESL